MEKEKNPPAPPAAAAAPPAAEQDLAAENARLKADLAAAQEALKKGGPAPIPGTYKGHAFVPGHKRVRDADGKMCDTVMLLQAANAPASEGHATACAVLDHLIRINYAYFTKNEAPAS
jgi:hypothetical protein